MGRAMSGVVVVGLPDQPTRTDVARGVHPPDWVPRAVAVQTAHRAQQDQDRHAHARYGQLDAENHRLRVALDLIAGDCVNKPGPSCPTETRLRVDHVTRIYRWCPACIARETLTTVNLEAA